MYKSKLISILFLIFVLGLIILAFVFPLLNNYIAGYICLFLAFILVIILMVIKKCEINKITKELEQADQSSKVRYSEENKRRCLTSYAANTLRLLLFVHYVSNGMYDKAKENMFLVMGMTPYSLYATYIYYLHEKDYKHAERIYNKMMKNNKPQFEEQRNMLILLKNFVFSGEYSPKLETTTYDYIKKLCEEYKNGTFQRIEL